MKRNKGRGWCLTLIVSLVLLAGCSTTISPKGRALMILSTYNSQAALTVDASEDCLARATACTEEERVVIRQKKTVFEKLDPLVKGYALTVNSGGVVDRDDEQAIYDLIDDLVGLGL